MGKALTLIGMWTFIMIVGMIVGLGAGAIDPNSELLFGNAMFGGENMISPYIQNSTQNPTYWSYNNTMASQLPQGSATGAGTTATVYPDWINSSLNWIKNTLTVLLNIVGAPYTFCMYMFGGSLAVVIGIGLSIINMFILVNWIFGKVD